MTRYRHSKEDVERAISRFFVVKGIVRTRLAEGRRYDPVSWLKVETLKFIADHAGATAHDIGKHLSITAASASPLVHRLIADGLVSRRTDPSDKRAAILSLTARGKRELKRALACGKDILKELFALLSPSEFRAFTLALRRIAQGGGTLEGDGPGYPQRARRGEGARHR